LTSDEHAECLHGFRGVAIGVNGEIAREGGELGGPILSYRAKGGELGGRQENAILPQLTREGGGLGLRVPDQCGNRWR
jgi:hypothetical protein